MRQPKKFSAQSIKEQYSSLPDTYYGDECNVSFHAEQIIRFPNLVGEPMRFETLGISYCCRGEIPRR